MADSHEEKKEETPGEKKEEGITAAAHAPDAHGGHDHHPTNVKAYFVVFVALCVVTSISFFANFLVRQHVISPFTSFIIILSVAVFKATLVAMYFMHLISDWKKVYILIIPTLVLGPLLVIVLLPDIVLAWKHVPTLP